MEIAKEQIRLLNRATLIPLLLVCSLAIVLAFFQNRISRTDHVIKQTDEVIKSARRIQLLLLLMESNYNSYVVTRREEFLKHYQLARTEVPDAFFNLSDLVEKSGGGHEFADLNTALGQWIMHSESLFGKPVPLALKEFESADFQRIGNMYLNGMRNAFEEFTTKHLKMRNQQIREAGRIKDNFLLFGVTLLIGVAVILAYYFRAQLHSAFLKYEIQTRRLRESRNELRETVKTRDQALQSRDEFIKIASHELNTPLQSLKLQTQMLQKQSTQTSLPPEKLTRYLERNDSQIDRLTQLVKDMLEITQLEDSVNKMRPQRVHLRELVEKLAVSSDIFISIDIEEDIEGLWDLARMEQILGNLISNAIKYGQGLPVAILGRKTAESIRIEVRDQGMGIPREALVRVFEKFERNISASEVSGLGLGLFITRELVKAHKGSIWVESKGLGHGSNFIIELPYQAQNILIHPARPNAASLKAEAIS